MDSEGTVHQLAAIISGDIVGYSRLIARDEAMAVRLVTAYREEVELLVKQNTGHLVDFTGDNFLAHFSSSLAAVRCAVEIQQVLKARNQSLPEDGRMQFRLGIHLGDVRMEGGRVFGTGVNVAARLEALADPGGICISGVVKDQLTGRIDLRTEDMGSKTVKNISQPVPVHRLIFGEASPSPGIKASGPSHRVVVAAATVVVLALLLLSAGFWFTQGGGDVLEGDVAANDPTRVRTVPSGTRDIPESSWNAPALHEMPSIVVLPFLNISGDSEQEYFADGISEDLTTDLAKIPQLFVIARNSAFTYKGKPVNVAQVGRDLGVRFVLEGSVRKVQDRVRITAQLIDATTGFHIWSERYDRDFSGIFEVQNEINAKILSALQITINEREMARIRRRPVENLNAYEAWHKGRTLIRQLTRERVAEGQRLLERAIELDPNYGVAYAELANSYMFEFLGWNLDSRLVDKAAKLTQRALELSPLSPVSHTSAATVEMCRFRPDKAIESARRAIELAPSAFDAYAVLGGAQMQMGLVDEAKASLEMAVRLNPLSVDITYTALASIYYQLDKIDEAVRLWERVRTSNPEALLDRLGLAHHYQQVGQSDLAKTIVREILQVNPSFTLEMAIEVMQSTIELPDELEREIVRNLELAGLP